MNPAVMFKVFWFSDKPPNDNPPTYDNAPNNNPPSDNPPKSFKRQFADTTIRRTTTIRRKVIKDNIS